MLSAVIERRNWRNTATSVTIAHKYSRDVAVVQLYQTVIAEVDDFSVSLYFPEAYATATTRDCLAAIANHYGVGQVNLRDRIWRLDGVRVKSATLNFDTNIISSK